MKRLAFALVAALITTTAAHAQLGVYAGYTASKLNVANTDYIYGPTFGAYFDSQRFPLLNLGLDVRVSVINSSSTTRVTDGFVGPRVAVHLPIVPLKPYAEALVGYAHKEYGQGLTASSGNAAAYGVAVGTDFRILPYLDWRILDFTYTRLQGNSSTSQKAFTTGLVLRIPLT